MKEPNFLKKCYIKTKIYLWELFIKNRGNLLDNTLIRLNKKALMTEASELNDFCKESNIDPIKFIKCDHINLKDNIDGDREYVDVENKEI